MDSKPDYAAFFRFSQSPFSLTPDPRFLYRSESHDLALQQVWQAIRRKEGFIVLTGDIGTGKTTLCRTILEQFDQTTFTALILNPFLSVEELLREREVDFVSFPGWQAIDAAETARGEPQGRPRVKFTRIEEMLDAAKTSV